MAPPATRKASEATTDAFTGPCPRVHTGLASGWLVDRPHLDGGAPRPFLHALAGQLGRWERRAAAHLSSPPHPLAEATALRGLEATERRRFLRHFRTHVAAEAWTNRLAAAWHLRALLPSWPVRSWPEVHGLHLFLGAAGAGKTTLLYSVAAQLTRAGQHVSAIALLPRGSPQRAAFTAFAETTGVEAAFASTAAELDHRLAARAGTQTILLDTPCSLTCGPAVSAALQHPLLRHPRTALHLCVSMQHAWAVQLQTLQLAKAQRFDFLAVSHLDLAPGGGMLIGLQLQGPWPLSWVHASPDPRVPPFPQATEALAVAWGLPRN